MRKYELSISADYVPEWGVTEAIREFFQNSIDEETRDASNKMFFDYDAENRTVRIGNKHSELDIKTLLFGVTTKSGDKEMIGNHGEGYMNIIPLGSHQFPASEPPGNFFLESHPRHKI